ncbi:MAG: efflux transporter outer membrane subunit [Syntrophobacteraceae bacterium]|nr:efflux transporter outer membrane subunit [Syntrophobacteraceae bacterium]
MSLRKRHDRFWPILVGSAMLLYGCMKVGPDYIRPQTSVSQNWLEVKDERVKTESAEYRAWWEAFYDPILNRIIDRAYRENLSLKIAGVRVFEARAQLGIAVGGLYPQAQQAAGSVIYSRTSERSSQAASSQGNIEFNYRQDQIGLFAAWEIDFWGKFGRAIEAADASLLAAVADYDSALVSLTADAANSYIRILTLQRRLDIARQNVETQKEALQIAEARFEGGTTSERDVEQARTVLFNTQSTIPSLEAQLSQAKNALSVLLALPPGNLESVVEGASDIPVPQPQVAVGIPADLLRRRPDVRSAELQAIAQSAQIGVAKADLLPAFSLTGSFGFLSTDVGKFGLSDMFSWKARTAAVGPSFQWNILNYGRITNNVRVQDARFQELLISYQNTVLRAQQEVEDSLAGYLRAQENAEFLARSADAAKRSLDLALIQYQQGIADFTTVLTAQQALLNSQDTFASALGNIAGSLVALYRSLGGGWQIVGQVFVQD